MRVNDCFCLLGTELVKLGGEVLVHTNNAAPGLGSAFQAMVFEIGSGQPNSIGSSFYAAGGSFTCGRDFVVQGNSTGSFDLTKKVSPVSATVDGSSNLDVYRLVVGGNATPGPAVVNLNGGILSTFLVTNTMSRKGWSCVNGNGGRLSIKSTVLERNQFMGVKAINVYEGGLSLDCQAGVVVGSGTTPVTLRTPKGFGVESIAYSGTQDYYYAPMVEISGGSGSNATAIALVDEKACTVTNILVTSHGWGYTAANTTVTLRYGTTLKHTFAAADVVIADNDIGGFTKRGANTFTLLYENEWEKWTRVEGIKLKIGAAGTVPADTELQLYGGTIDVNHTDTNEVGAVTFGGFAGTGGTAINGAVRIVGEWRISAKKFIDREASALAGTLDLSEVTGITLTDTGLLDDEEVRKLKRMNLFSATEVVWPESLEITGVPEGWKVIRRPNGLSFGVERGLMLIFR